MRSARHFAAGSAAGFEGLSVKSNATSLSLFFQSDRTDGLLLYIGEKQVRGHECGCVFLQSGRLLFLAEFNKPKFHCSGDSVTSCVVEVQSWWNNSSYS